MLICNPQPDHMKDFLVALDLDYVTGNPTFYKYAIPKIPNPNEQHVNQRFCLVFSEVGHVGLTEAAPSRFRRALYLCTTVVSYWTHIITTRILMTCLANDIKLLDKKFLLYSTRIQKKL